MPQDAYADTPTDTSLETVDVTTIKANAVVEDLNFWSPDAPNLYDVYTILKHGDTVLDVQKITTGFRKVEYDINDGGLKINEQPVWLTGYAQRSTNEWAVIGVANDWLQDYDMQLIKESNSNFIRWMHVAPKPAQIRSGDKYGVVSAAPAGDKEGDTDGRAWDQRVEAMRDVIIYFRNSPSVLFWEAGNNAITAAHQQEMTDLKATLDPNGGRFSGCRTLSSVDQIKAADYVGTMLNRHASGAKASMATAKKYVPIMETEYARDEAPRRVWDDFSPPDYDYDNKWLGAGASKDDGYDVHDLTSEDFAVVDARAYNEFYSDRVGGSSGNDYYSAAAIMVWSDSNMHNRNTASENCRTSGKVDAVRIKKEAFYALQAAQSTEPKIHIVGHWNYPSYTKGDKENGNYWYAEKAFNGKSWEKTGTMAQRDPTKKTVYVIGSPGLSKVELYVNDNLKGTATKPDSSFVYAFPNIDVTESGTVHAVAYNAREEVIAEDDISTVGEAKTIKLTPVVGPDGLRADGSDIAYFDLAVVDENGNTCPLAYDKINLSVNGEGVLLGGYNSGVGDKITTNKDYVFAECGTNRIFVRSTRTAGNITLSASLEGKPAVTATVQSKAVELTGGLTTTAQQTFKQGEIIQIVPQQVDPLKPLAVSVDADFSDKGNTYAIDPNEDLDSYTMKLNGEEISGYASLPYRPDSTTGVLCDAVKTLEALKAINPDIEYTIQTEGDVPAYTDGKLPILSITGGLKDGYTQIDVQNGSTTLFINAGEEKNLLNAEITAKGDELIVDIAAMLGYLDNVSYNMNTNTNTANIIYNSGNAAAAVLEYGNDTARVTAIEPINAKLIFASYDNNTLKSVSTKTVKLTASGAYNDYTPSSSFVKTDDMKVMLWEGDWGAPLAEAVIIDGFAVDTAVLDSYDEDTDVELFENDDEVSLFAADAPEAALVSEYDTLIAKHTCESTSISTNLTIEDGAPNGTKYIKTKDSGNNKYGEYCFESECAFSGNTKEDVMIAADIRFDAEYAGITAEDKGDAKVAGAIVLKGSTIQVQKSSKDYNDTNITVDKTSWYHIALVGRYSAADANVDMYVWKYNSDGTKTYVGKAANIALRNLSASNNNGVSHLNVLSNTSIDNIALYKLGADALALSSASDTIKAGETMLFTYSATRAGEYITAPAVTWAVYDEDDSNALNDENISISDSGLLTIGGNATAQNINVRATTESGVYASKAITVDAIDTSTDTYDAIELSADKSTVRVDSPVTLTATTTKDGEEVTPGEGDLFWKVYNAGNLRELGNKNITITDGVLSVTEDAVPQTVTVKAVNKSGSVSGTYQIEVLPANMNTGNEDEYTDTYVSSDACEEYISGTTLKEGSWDGSAYYTITAAYDFAGFPSNTTADVIYSADMQFANDGAGWTVFNASKGKLGLQLSSSGTKLNAVGASNKVVGSMDIDKNAWYNVQVMCATGKGGDSYAICSVYKYDENGNRVHPSDGTADTPYNLTVNLRNLSEDSANHININAGTNVDNVMNFKVSPNELQLTLDAETVVAGGRAQASAKALRNGIVFPKLSNSLIKYEIYDSEDKYPLGNDKIAIDANGRLTVDAMVDAQIIYVRLSSVSGGMYDSKPITIKSSDIFEVKRLGFNEDYSVLGRLDITKSFDYDDDVTFISAVYDSEGLMKAITAKKTLGKQLNMGANRVSMNMAMPSDFNSQLDRLGVFVITNLSTNKEPDAVLTLTASGNKTTLTNLPEFDAETKLVVLALKPGANEGKVTDADIAYFNQISSSTVEEALTLPVSPDSGTVIKISGKKNGQQVIARGALE